MGAQLAYLLSPALQSVSTLRTPGATVPTLTAYIFSPAGQGYLLYQPRSHLGPKPVHRRFNLGEGRSGMLLPPVPYLQHHPFSRLAPIALHPFIPHHSPSFPFSSTSSTTSTLNPTVIPLYHLPRKSDGHPNVRRKQNLILSEQEGQEEVFGGFRETKRGIDAYAQTFRYDPGCSQKDFATIEDAMDFVESFRQWELHGVQDVTVEREAKPVGEPTVLDPARQGVALPVGAG